MAQSEPGGSGVGKSGLTSSFRSSGLHVLEPYISPHTVTGSGQPVTSERGQSNVNAPWRSHGAHAPEQTSREWAGHISADNVGFRLLRKAGWSVGTGLGAGEQGRRDPIEPAMPKGTRGLGFDSQAAQRQQQQQQQQGSQGQHQQGRKRSAAEARRGGDVVAALVREELAAESLDQKVARHRHNMSVEAEQQRSRAIDRYLRSAFNDPFDSIRSDNSNPLSRIHRLTESNPLLDPIGD